jgi:hypothetical protein
MPGTTFAPGDLCRIQATVCNAALTPLVGYPLFVILDIAGSFYFAPAFSSYDNYLPLFPQFPPGQTEVAVLPAFSWPSGVGTFSGCVLYGALTNPGVTNLYGAMDTWTFGWSQ